MVYSVLYTALYTFLYNKLYPHIKVACWPDFFTEKHHLSVNCTYHQSLHSTDHYTVHFTVHYILHSAVHCTLHYTLYKHQSGGLVWPISEEHFPSNL